jgi:colicin import membrane protein
MQRVRDRWVSIALSVLLHGALLAALVYGWLLYRRPPAPAPTLAIEATVVDARTARGALQAQPAPPAAPQPENPPPEPPPESVGPPQPTPEELAQREQQRQQEEAAAAQKAAEEQAAKEAAEQAARQAEEQRQAEAKAAAERKAKEAEAQKRAAEERERQADAQDQSEREADLKRSLAAEEQASTSRSGPAREAWLDQIKAKIQRAWIRPPSARPGIECVLDVTQVPGGEVTEVSVGQCNGDQAVRESIEVAAYRASPLPAPPDPAMFDRHLAINFKPDSD